METEQIPPRGTPEFEEYKKTVEEAHRNGAVIEIDVLKGEGWEICPSPAFDAWHDSLYRIAPNQPRSFQNQQQKPSMTPTEQRIVEAVWQLSTAVAALSISNPLQMSGKLVGEQSIAASQKVLRELRGDLPLPSPSEAPASPTAPAVEAGTALSEQIGGSHYKDCAIQPVEFITANKLNFLEGCVVKRICRHRNKNGIEDLRKAIHEIELLIELEYGKEQG